ncbi:hypothetical protein ACIBQ1_09725 [Nonomuraea sp. NPDC050153]|uniref:hypothetical protein n=1 Tax=Nonomuraea sp. NPDC050153 TaxID=3364359 RepID=UPI0037B08764
MPDIPQEALQAATVWLKGQYERTFTGGCPPLADFEDDARDFLEAAASILAAHARHQALQDAAAGRVTLEEWATVQGVTVPQRIEDLQSKESFTPEEVEAFFAVLDEPSCCDQVRRETAQQIAREILRQKPSGNTSLTWESGLRRGARIARQIGEARDSR